jgi:hypothetical protein
MKIRLHTPMRLLDRLYLALTVTAFLPPFLLAAFLILIAPLPQSVIHVRWCFSHLDTFGIPCLLLGVCGVVATVTGLSRRWTRLHRAGLLCVVAPVVGIAFHRAIINEDGSDLPLLGAFLFSVLLAYLTVNEQIKHRID